jgi:predicted nucleotidyltransferase
MIMHKYGEYLKTRINEFRDMLANHEILKEYWSELSLILKGSVARGNADQYSDLDFVFYCKESVREKIIQQYFERKLIPRTDGLFLPLPKWIGHYSLESFETFESYFTSHNYAQIWECQNVMIISDPENRYKTRLDTFSKNLFSNVLRDIKAKYLELKLELDWIRHPLQRGDEVAALLHGANILKGICQLSYLIDQKPYPHVKWIDVYLETTVFGKKHHQDIRQYAKNLSVKNSIPKHMPLFFYSQYRQGQLLLHELGKLIRRLYGDQPWIKEWYLYV